MFNDEQNFVHGPRQSYENLTHFNIYHPISQPIYNASYNVNVQHNFIYPSGSTYDNADNDSMPKIAVEKRQSDEKDIENFLLELQQFNDTSDNRYVRKTSKIAISKSAIASAYKLNEQLKAICAELKDNSNIAEEEWQIKIDACNSAKAEITKLLEPIKDPNLLNRLIKDLEKRKKKRAREKLKKEKWKNEKLLRIEKRARLHAEIDLWIRKEQAVIEKEIQDENLRKDADMILSDVRAKRSDARKYLGLLQELQNLRNIKANIARARGEHLSSAVDEAFNNIIEKLTEQWSTLDREYSIEEQGLKLMLKTDNEKRIEKQKKCLFDEWENILFGRKILMSDPLQLDLNSFVTVRTAWDKYISSERDASAIPIGWIMPDKPSSAAWQKSLKKEFS